MVQTAARRGDRPLPGGLRLALVISLLSCTGDDPASDAGHDVVEEAADVCATGLDCGSRERGGTPPEECPSQHYEAEVCLPLAPAPPGLTDWECPAGWVVAPADPAAASEEALPEYTLCAPPPLPESCPAGSMAVPGQATCIRQGGPCPAAGDDWAEPEAIHARAPGYAGDVWYVRTNASDGDGRREQPFGTIAEALAIAVDGDVVALARGDYLEMVTVRRPVALVGACVEATRLVAPSQRDDLHTLRITGSAGGWVADLTVTGPRGGVLVSQTTGASHLEAIHIDRARNVGIQIDTAAATTLSNVRVTETAAGSEGAGIGLVVTRGRVELAGGGLHANRDAGVLALSPAADLTLREVAVTDTASREDGSRGRGLVAEAGARLAVERGIVERNRDTGVLSLGSATQASLTDVIVRATSPDGQTGGGRGVQVLDGASLTATRARLEGNHEAGWLVDGAGSSATLLDVVIADTRGSAATGLFGRGLVVQAGAVATAQRLLLSGNREQSLAVSGVGSRLTAVDVVVAISLPAGDGSAGLGLSIDAGGQAELERALVVDAHTVGVFVSGASRLLLRDGTIADVAPRVADDAFGRGLNLEAGAVATLARVAVRRTHDLGVLVHGPDTALEAEDLEVADVQPRPTDGGLGRGLDVEGGAVAEITRVALRRNGDAGAFVFGPGSQLVLTDAIVRETRVAAGTGGSGLVSVSDAALVVGRFVVRECELAGVQLPNTGRIQASDGLITRNFVGINLADSSLDLTSAFVRVESVDNELDIRLSEVPVPSASDALVGAE